MIILATNIVGSCPEAASTSYSSRKALFGLMARIQAGHFAVRAPLLCGPAARSPTLPVNGYDRPSRSGIKEQVTAPRIWLPGARETQPEQRADDHGQDQGRRPADADPLDCVEPGGITSGDEGG